MVLNFLSGGAAINVLARLHHVALTVVDMGVDADLPQHPHLLHHKIARGTANMLDQPAMTQAQLEQALHIGATLAAQAAAQGHTVVALGEMGIGNTTRRHRHHLRTDRRHPRPGHRPRHRPH